MTALIERGLYCTPYMTGASTAEVALRAQQLLEQSLLGELRAVVARALSGLEMFSGQLSELVSEIVAPAAPVSVCSLCNPSSGLIVPSMQYMQAAEQDESCHEDQHPAAWKHD